jgi:hypothetical protein
VGEKTSVFAHRTALRDFPWTLEIAVHWLRCGLLNDEELVLFLNDWWSWWSEKRFATMCSEMSIF